MRRRKSARWAIIASAARRLLADLRRDHVEGVEQEVRVELHLERRQARLEQLPLEPRGRQLAVLLAPGEADQRDDGVDGQVAEQRLARLHREAIAHVTVVVAAPAEEPVEDGPAPPHQEGVADREGHEGQHVHAAGDGASLPRPAGSGGRARAAPAGRRGTRRSRSAPRAAGTSRSAGRPSARQEVRATEKLSSPSRVASSVSTPQRARVARPRRPAARPSREERTLSGEARPSEPRCSARRPPRLRSSQGAEPANRSLRRLSSR